MSSSTTKFRYQSSSKSKVEDLNKRSARTSSSATTKALKKNELKNKEDGSVSYEDLVSKLKGTGKLWEDPDFKAESASVFVSNKSKNFRDFEWQRPKDICKDPVLFSGGASRFDVKQGALGDCWLLAVIASLSMYEPIFKNVVPHDQDFKNAYIGAFRFRFWQFGKWVDVIVDDRLPTSRSRLVFMHSADSNEFWSALLEKAYAKLNGTYEALNGGSQSEAMEDFTGGLCETIKLNPKERPANIFAQMGKFVKQSSLMGCAIESSRIEGVLTNGLIEGHAYSLTAVDTVLSKGKTVELVRVRNPWGNEKEWKGRWSDNSAEWDTISAKDKERLVSNFGKDGEFWMTCEDFVENFTKLEVCHLGPESIDTDMEGKRRWEMSLEDSSWTTNVNAGGCRNFLDSFITNPQYRIEVVDPDEDDEEDMGTLIVGLMQKDMRKRNKDFYVIGYCIYKLKDPKCGILNKSFFKFSSTIAKSPGFVNLREICGRHKLAPGHYVIVPSTFNPNEEAEFILRIFSQKPNKIGELDAQNGRIGIAKHLTDETDSNTSADDNTEVKRLEGELEQMFVTLSGPGNVINACQLRELLNAYFKRDPSYASMKNFNGFDIEVCRSMIALYDDNHTGKMEFHEFILLFRNLRTWKNAFKEFDADDNGVFDAFEFRNALTNCGLSVSNALFKVVGNRYSDPEKGTISFVDFTMALIRLTNAFETMELQTKDAQKRLTFSSEEFMECLLYM